MKNVSCTIVCSFLFVLCFSQGDTLVNGRWFNLYSVDNSPVTDSVYWLYIENGSFETGCGFVFGIYPRSGKLYCAGEWMNYNFTGHFISWHENGMKESEGEYYTGGGKTGNWKWFFDDGTLKAEANYKVKRKFWDWLFGDYISYPSFYSEFYADGRRKYFSSYKNCEHFSVKTYFDNGNLCHYENYRKDTSVWYCENGDWIYAYYRNEYVENEFADTLCTEDEIQSFFEISCENFSTRYKQIKVKF